MTRGKSTTIALLGVILAVGLAGTFTKVSHSAISDVAEPEKLIAKEFGDVLLFDREAHVIISVQRKDGKVAKVLINYFDDLEQPGAKTQITTAVAVPQPGKRPLAEYTVSPGAETAETTRMLNWRDLNGDGIWDLRTVAGNWPEIDETHDKGTGVVEVMIGGKWRAVTGALKDDKTTATVDGAVYHFDATRGVWGPAK